MIFLCKVALNGCNALLFILNALLLSMNYFNCNALQQNNSFILTNHELLAGTDCSTMNALHTNARGRIR